MRGLRQAPLALRGAGPRLTPPVRLCSQLSRVAPRLPACLPVSPSRLQGHEWEEKWGERYWSAGRADKWADKWAREGADVWHEKWGENYDGSGAPSPLTAWLCWSGWAVCCLGVVATCRRPLVPAAASAGGLHAPQASLGGGRRAGARSGRGASGPPTNRSHPNSRCHPSSRCHPAPLPPAGGCVKYTDKWAEREVEGGAREQWGDKWEENFKDGRGTKQVRPWAAKQCWRGATQCCAVGWRSASPLRVGRHTAARRGGGPQRWAH